MPTNEPELWTDGNGNYFHECVGYYTIPLYKHPKNKLKEAIKIIKDFQNSDVPPCKYYEDNYADGWMDACNEILWAIEKKAKEK